MLIKRTDFPHYDVAVQHAQQDADLAQQHVALPLGDLGHGDLQHHLNQVAFPNV